jgi:hypothetical protein
MNLDELNFPDDADLAMCWAARHEYQLRQEAWIRFRIGPEGVVRMNLHQFGRELAKMKEAGREVQRQMEEFWRVYGETFQGDSPDEPHLRVVK